MPENLQSSKENRTLERDHRRRHPARFVRQSPAQASTALLDGNQSFVSGASLHPSQGAVRLGELAAGQAPFGVAPGFSDSSSAAEIIFAQGLGGLFVVRTAGYVTSGRAGGLAGAAPVAVDGVGGNADLLRASATVPVRPARPPTARTSTPEEIASAVLYLAGDAASFVQGVPFPVDAGRTAV
ncbi:SDR family oxidoreductase [Streptomyces sp. NPDC059466]|uniref:SDR family oxidoreductase n=1 Tax=unclassified Streptomyces TaxID=2593676 RepID=UPI00367450F3